MSAPATVRSDHQHRVTKETDVDVDLVVDGVGKASASTGIPFSAANSGGTRMH